MRRNDKSRRYNTQQVVSSFLQNGYGIIIDNNSLYLIGYTLYLVYSLLSASFYQRYLLGVVGDVIAGTCIAIFFAKELLFTTVDVFTMLFFFIAGFFVLLAVSAQTMPFVTAIVAIYTARDIDFKRITRVTVYISIITMCFIILSSRLGIIDDYVLYDTSGRIRHYLGFRYTLYPPTIMFNITACIVYLRKKQFWIKDALILLLFNYILYKLTQSRLTFFTSVLLICIALLINIVRINNWNPYLLLVPIYPIIALLSVVLCLTYDSGKAWMKWLNTITSNRIALGRLSLMQYGLRMLSNREIIWTGVGADAFGRRSKLTMNYVDNLYIRLLQRYGIIFFALILILLTVAMYVICKNKHRHLAVIMAILALHGFIDDLIFNLYFNTFLIVLIAPIMVEFKQKIGLEETNQLYNIESDVVAHRTNYKVIDTNDNMDSHM